MHKSTQPQGFLVGIRQIFVHGAITLLAIAIAFSLPAVARYILYVWWPRVETDTSLLLVTESGLASALVLLFNLGKVAWDNRNKVAMARLTALVYARRQPRHRHLVPVVPGHLAEIEQQHQGRSKAALGHQQQAGVGLHPWPPHVQDVARHRRQGKGDRDREQRNGAMNEDLADAHQEALRLCALVHFECSPSAVDR